MTQDTIIEGNRLIAKFVGKDVMITYKDASGKSWNSMVGIESMDKYDKVFLQYHEDCRWIMDAVDKIMDIDITPVPQWTGYRMEIVPRGYVKISGFPMPTITTNVSVEGGLINALWKAVIKFIQYYNTTQSKEQVTQ